MVEDDIARRRAHDAALVRAALDGDADAFARLYDSWFDRVYDLVVRIVRRPDVAQEVCQDTFLAAWRNLHSLTDHDAFGGWLLRIARNTALNQSGRDARMRPVDDETFAVLSAGHAGPEAQVARADDPEVAVADAELATMVQEVAQSLGERDAQVLDLQLRYDLTPAEIGDVMGVSRNAANQLCHRARLRFASAFGARMLWHGAQPRCPRLRAELAAAGIESFGSDAVRVTEGHVAECADCAQRRRTRLQPAALFSAVPVAAAPLVVKEAVSRSLASQGVPVPSTGGTGGTGGSTVSSTGSGPAPPPPPRAPGPDGAAAAASSGSSSRSSSRTARQLVAVGVVVVVVLAAVAALLLAGRGGSDGDSSDAAARGTVTTGAAPALSPGPATDPNGSTAPRTAPTTRASSKTTTTTAAPPTTATPTTAPPTLPVVEQLVLAPATDQYGSWTLGPDAPLLTWRVSGADSVTVSIWYDDGVNGSRRFGTVSSDPTGSVRVCPGLQSGNTCQAPNGLYTFVVEAAGPAGSVVSSDSAPPPGFHVYPPIT